MIVYFKDEHKKSGKKHDIYKMLSTVFKSIDTFVFLLQHLLLLHYLLLELFLIIITISTAVACALAINNKVVEEFIESVLPLKNFTRENNRPLFLLTHYIDHDCRML